MGPVRRLVKHGGKNGGRGASSGGGENRGIFQSVSKNVDFMEKQLETFVQNVIDEEIMEDLQGENQEISDRMLASAEKVARLRYLNMSMKENIDKELLNVAKGREEIRTNNAAIDEEIRRLQEQADQDDEHVRKELEIKQEVVKGKRGNGFDPEIIKEATKKIKKNTEALLAAFDHKKDPLVKSVRKKLTGAEDEDDIVVQNKGMGESDIKCPYAMVTFTQPYCNKSRFPCDHHLEKSSVDAMAQKAHANNGFWNCPTVGCKGKWAKDTSELDTKFLRRVEKYVDKMEAQGAAGKGKGKGKGGMKASVIVDDEEEEEDYTEI